MGKLNQDDLLEIFYALKKIIEPYEKGTIRSRLNIEGKYDLWSEKDLVAHGKKREEMFFVALTIQSGYVGFYFMPIYTNNDEIKPLLNEPLLKTLKGKSCFHIKSIDNVILEEVKNAMKHGYETYRKNGWV